jgi:peroxiredoxin
MQFVLLLLAAFAGGGTAGDQERAPSSIGVKVADVAMQDVTGKRRTLSEFKNKKAIVVVFVGTECPIANLYYPTLADMQKRYAAKGVQVLAINSNPQDSLADVAEHARERNLPFPVLKDADQSAADAFGAHRTPEAFLLDGGRTIRYRGRIDDQYGYTYRRGSPTRTELKDALEEVLAGKPVTTPESVCQGCVIGRVRKEGPNNRVKVNGP